MSRLYTCVYNGVMASWSLYTGVMWGLYTGVMWGLSAGVMGQGFTYPDHCFMWALPS